MKLFFKIILILFLSFQANAFEAISHVVENENSVSDSNTTKTPIINFKPIISLSGGWLTFFGDVTSNQKANGILLSNLTADLEIIFPISNGISASLHTLLGKLSANERSVTRNLNFTSQIQTFGLKGYYNFDHFLKKERLFDPYISLGFDALIFNSKIDLYNKDDLMYYYWSTGDIKDLPETPENKNTANTIQRDYEYETDIRASGITGSDNYNKYSFALPVGIGLSINLSPRLQTHIGATYNFLFTDLIDGVSKNGIELFKGSGSMDGILYSHIGLSYNLTHVTIPDPYDDKISNEELNELTKGDTDFDGIIDINDDCLETPAGVEVDEKGCPLDGDNDGVPDYKDIELETAEGLTVDTNGVALTDEEIEMIALRFLDSTGVLSPIHDTIYTNELPSKSARVVRKKYSVQVSSDSLTNEQAADLLGSEKLKSVKDEDDETILVGEYDNVGDAIAKNAELREKGISTKAIVEESVTGKIVTADTRGEVVNLRTGRSMPEGTVFRIQLGAFRKTITKNIFGDLDVIGINNGDGYTRFFTGNFTNLDAAAAAKVRLVGEGYSDCLIKAFSKGEQVSLSTAGAEFDPNSSSNTPSTIGNDKSKLRFKIQLGAYEFAIPMDHFNRFVKIGKIQDEKGLDNKTRYYVGSFSSYVQAEAFMNELDDFEIFDTFIVGEYDGKTITAKEAIKIAK